MVARFAAIGFCACLGLSAASCQKIVALFQPEATPPDPCDPTTNVYYGETHFFERELVREDGTLDFERWMSLKEDPRSSPCDPLHEDYQAEQNLRRSAEMQP